MVKKLIAKPHLFFFALIPILILISFFYGEEPIDVNVHDTYFVSEIKFWCYLSAVFFALIGLNYFSLLWAQKPPKKWLTILHISFQIIAFILLLTRNNWNWVGKQYPQELQFLNEKSEAVILIAFIFFILSVFFHLINFFTSLFLKTE